MLYVGRAGDLRRRVGSYWGELRERAHLAPMVARIARVEALSCDSEHEAAWLERNLLERARPPWNRTSGTESPVYIRLERRGPRMVHEVCRGVSHFGPYLGGLKVRLATSALHRLLPVGYAADGLSGTAREMARVLGVDPCDRDALIAAAAAVLDREPAALAAFRRELERRRDAAAGVLSFELAARLQAEIAAVDWVSAEQKVTSAEPRDLDVHGFADGVAVRFEIRAGRLCGWRAYRARRARGPGPPAQWVGFATRNAELAARLLTPA